MSFFLRIISRIYYAGLTLSCLGYPEETRYIDVNGQHLLYAVRGSQDGAPVVLVHGNGGSHKSMRTQAMQLAKAGYRVYSLDSRGQGANPELQEYHYADMMEDTYQFIVKLGLKRPAFYGWSDGGIIGLMLEIAHPGTVSLMAVSGANLCPDCGDNFEEFKSWILEQGTPLAMMMLNEPDIAPEQLHFISCPVLVTAGENDVIGQEHTKLIADSIPCSELEIFPGEDHGSYIKRSPKMGKRLLKFLKDYRYGMKKTVAVYLGSADAGEKYMNIAYDFGKALAQKGVRVVYGGADVGTMKALADGVLDAGGEIIGVFPCGFGGKREVAAMGKEILRKDVSRIIEVKDFAERKKVMGEMSDCCIALPGSYGTMDELFCYAVENEIGLHDKTAYILNIDGYYDGLEAQVATMKREGFINPDSKMITFLYSVEDFLKLL